ncbi:hypothetical protein JMM63_20680 [Rhodovulum sulfidophilum]|uniref:hypothetical protein n=1 Tax=Rhodovulum sulfidophilum TaxID=35806 RepID=UPI0019205EB7|nr:hypothetical protein [Rhodovulum sulfidophilum]MBL3597935.1 hypothetical protein [Rhodovulum sulfidophilum]
MSGSPEAVPFYDRPIFTTILAFLLAFVISVLVDQHRIVLDDIRETRELIFQIVADVEAIADWPSPVIDETAARSHLALLQSARSHLLQLEYRAPHAALDATLLTEVDTFLEREVERVVSEYNLPGCDLRDQSVYICLNEAFAPLRAKLDTAIIEPPAFFEWTAKQGVWTFLIFLTGLGIPFGIGVLIGRRSRRG